MKTQVQTAQSQEKFVIKIDKNLAKIIDSDTRKKLTDAYLKLFSGFSWINWTNKKSLGQSWHNALGQCEGFIKTKSPSNPVTKYMKCAYDAHKKYWSKVIMTNKNSQNTLNKPEIEAKQMRAYGIKLIREAMGIINLIYEQFKQYQIEFSVDKTSVKTAEVSKTQSNAPQAQPVAKAVEQTMPSEQKNVAQLQQQTAQPNVQAIAKPQQVIQPAQQTQQAQAKAQEQVKPAVQVQPVAKAQEQVKPAVQAQPVAKAQEQVTPAIQAQPVAKVAEQAKAQHAPKPVQWQYAQIKLQQQVHAIAKPQQVKQPVAKVPEKVKPQQVKQPEQKITSLKPVQETQIKQQQIKMFMFAKYNQKTA
jgi:hypothetical protein